MTGALLTVRLPTELSQDLAEINWLVQAYDAATNTPLGAELTVVASGTGATRTLSVEWQEPARLKFAVTLRFGLARFNARSPASAQSTVVTVGALGAGAVWASLRVLAGWAGDAIVTCST